MESSSHVSKCVPIIILCFSIGLRANAVTSSLESASVSMDSGFRTTATAYNIENSLSVGILCQYLQSSASTAAIACCCSRTLSVISYVNPSKFKQHQLVNGSSN